MKFILIIFFCISFIGCHHISDNSNINATSTISEENQAIAANQSKEDSLREDYYGFDTLFIQEYLTDNNNNIKLEGSKSNDVYRIVVKNEQGLIKYFQIADEWYGAAHSSIQWDNNEFIFVRYSCGTSCWGAKVLSLNDSRGILDFPEYVYVDSIRNIIAYPDTINWEGIFIENFESQKRMSLRLEFCSKAADPMLMIDTVYLDIEDNLNILFKGKDCRQIKKVVNISQIKN